MEYHCDACGQDFENVGDHINAEHNGYMMTRELLIKFEETHIERVY